MSFRVLRLSLGVIFYSNDGNWLIYSGNSHIQWGNCPIGVVVLEGLLAW